NVTGRDFTAQASAQSPYIVSGAVSGAIADGVLITLSGESNDTTTTANGGLYSFSGLANGTYTITPSLAGYTFTPASISGTVDDADVTGQNFTAAR
ncbi:MAG TPA: SdrD B-like domain-containing protein, partial [Anaeromyxobacteraceae bacterium]|nr:SdrD B-like domain-containing protein [Anaeromyxobacteraceae bacterium]